MNIFEIFCDGKGRITETNMSSILNFLLDPKRAHGFGHSSLSRFLRPIKDDLIRTLNNSNITTQASTEIDLDRWIKRFTKIELSLEEDVYENQDETKPRKRVLDSVIRFYEGNDLSWVLAIENKISMGSISDDKQLIEEYSFLRQSIKKNISIIFIFLTPNLISNSSQLPFDSLKLEGVDKKFNYIWKDSGDNPRSIIRIAQALLDDERSGRINPASSHADLFLRSMIKFISNDFQVETSIDEYVSSDNAMSIITYKEFWKKWKKEKKGSYFFAKKISLIIRQSLNQYCKESGLNDRYQLDYRANSTRLVFFFHPLDQDIDLNKKKLPNRPVAIFFGNTTSQKRIQLQFERADGLSLDGFRRKLNDEMKTIFDRIQPEESSPNYTTMHLRVNEDLNILSDLLLWTIIESAKSAIG